MNDQRKQNDLYWKAMRNRQIENEYEDFLREQGLQRGSDSAYHFAIAKQADGFREMKERDLILLLAGELPYMYD